MNQPYASVLDTIGATPVVRLNSLAPAGVRLYAKVEARNPMGSVKDRMALRVIEEAERNGRLRPGQTVIEATSGNTGIGLAMVCAVKGYPLVLVMAENFSVERRRILRHLGARVVLTPASEKGTGMLAKAEELARAHDWFLVRQFENQANALAHRDTTGREIIESFAGSRLDWFVTGYGTGGTLNGVAEVLRAERPEVRIAVCEPDNSPMLGSGIPHPLDAGGSHPLFRPHLMQGWSPDFIPGLTEAARAAGAIDRIVPVAGDRALELARALARREGLFCGISSGATLAGALEIAAEAEPGTTILCMLPDTGERYLSTPLFEDVPIEMTSEELEISRSTPGGRFDVPAPSAAASEAGGEPVSTSDRAEDHIASLLEDRSEPVVLFALEWCEFCWSVRKLFQACGIEFRSVDLDSVRYQEGNFGGELRAVLHRLTGQPTIPQLFIGGQWIGGCSETFEAYQNGSLASRLESLGLNAELPELDPSTFLPGWLQRREPVAPAA